MDKMMTSIFFIIMLMGISRTLGEKRNIVFIVADDLGWNDVGFHNSDIISPNIDRLAREGIILNSSYAQPVCTPSRNSYMTGVYPFKLGLQRGVFAPTVPECSPFNLEFLPEKLKKLGYATHMVGKWHLGFCNLNCTPTYRGFDSFLGFHNGGEDFYTKDFLGGIDFYNNTDAILNTTYSTFIYAERAVQIIEDHDTSNPLFLYFPLQSVHCPLQVPQRFYDMYPNVSIEKRRILSAMVTSMDEAIGQVVDALERTGLIEDTLIIFTSDNGGVPTSFSNNYPLRGAKNTIYEGGTRAAGFVYGNGLRKTGFTYNGLIHAVDWLPTIVGAAGGNTKFQKDIDGIDLWTSIRTGKISKRREFVYNLDNDRFLNQQGYAAIRVGKFKLIQGYPGSFRDWYKPDEELFPEACAVDEFQTTIDIRDQENVTNPELFYQESLYNLEVDPTERNDLSAELPWIVHKLKAKLDKYRESLVPPAPKIPDPASSPVDGYWSPGWC